MKSIWLLIVAALLIATLIHFHLFSGLFLALGRIGLGLSVIMLILALFYHALFKLVGFTFVFSLGLVFLSMAVMSPEQKAEWDLKENQAQQKREAEKAPEKPPQQTQQTQTLKQAQAAPSTDGPGPNVNQAALWGALLTQTFHKNGSDVVVYDLDAHTLLFDCTKELDPRTSCYVLYKTFPKNRDEAKVLKMMGIHTFKYKIEDGLLSGFAWEKELR